MQLNILNPGSVSTVSGFISTILKSFLSSDMLIQRRAMSQYQQKIWTYLNQLKLEMKDWLSGFELEVTELIRNCSKIF